VCVSVGVGVDVLVSVGVLVSEGVNVAVGVLVSVSVGVAVGVLVSVGVAVAVGVGVSVGGGGASKIITNRGANDGLPLKLWADFRPLAEPVPRRRIVSALPPVQSPRATISCTTAVTGRNLNHVFAAQETLE
jgi:hypothetical protein